MAPPEMASLLQDAEAKVLFVARGFAAIAASLELPALDRFVAMDEADCNWYNSGNGETRRLRTIVVSWPLPKTPLCSSIPPGRGLPKGVELANTNILMLIACYERHDVMRLSSDDVALVCMPVFHIAGTGVGLLCLAQGAQTLLLEEVKVADIIDAITRHQVNLLLLVRR